jgi:hypothetical protein
VKICFAAPLSSNAEKTFNQNPVPQVEKPGFDVFALSGNSILKKQTLFNRIFLKKRLKAVFNPDRGYILFTIL